MVLVPLPPCSLLPSITLSCGRLLFVTHKHQAEPGVGERENCCCRGVIYGAVSGAQVVVGVIACPGWDSELAAGSLLAVEEELGAATGGEVAALRRPGPRRGPLPHLLRRARCLVSFSPSMQSPWLPRLLVLVTSGNPAQCTTWACRRRVAPPCGSCVLWLAVLG
jgi:hypothetical protein